MFVQVRRVLQKPWWLILKSSGRIDLAMCRQVGEIEQPFQAEPKPLAKPVRCRKAELSEGDPCNRIAQFYTLSFLEPQANK